MALIYDKGKTYSSYDEVEQIYAYQTISLPSSLTRNFINCRFVKCEFIYRPEHRYIIRSVGFITTFIDCEFEECLNTPKEPYCKVVVAGLDI